MSSKKAKGVRAKTRHSHSSKGQLTVNQLLQEFSEGDTVIVVLQGSLHAGMPHRRYKGIVGTIIGKQGRSYKIATKLGNQKRTIIIASAHLRLANNDTGATPTAAQEIPAQKITEKVEAKASA
jgi:large subunit ribosomal protein L21e